jgi:transmembrane 9 superfamily protein 2/4
MFFSCFVCLPINFMSLWLQGDELKVKVNKLTSTKTQLPYSYYSLPYCPPDKIVDSAENLGEVLRGDRIENSPYVVS